MSLNTEIRGFTIQHGSAGSWGSIGGGILCISSSPTITDNIIAGNGAGKGAGIYCYNWANPLIQYNQIIYNDGYYGIGIGLRFSNPVIKCNNISYNTSSGGWAGGIDCYDSSPVIIGNTINDNTTLYGGAGIYCSTSHSIIQFNDVCHNTSMHAMALSAGIMYYSCPVIARANYNNLFDNYLLALNMFVSLYNHCGEGSLNAEYNWWGDPSGPGGDGPGNGDHVYLADFTPWLQEPAPPLPIVSLPDVSSGTPGNTTIIPILVSELLPMFGVVSAEFDLTFDSDILTGIGVETAGTLLHGTDWTCEYNATGNSIHLEMAGTDIITGTGALIDLLFTVSPDAAIGDESPLLFVTDDFILFNQGTLASDTQDGVFVVESVDVDEPIVPTELAKVALYQNYPNPFNPQTTISFSVAQTLSFVNLEIFNIKGQKVKTLIDEKLPAGTHQVVWDGKDDNNKSVSSGIYFYRINSGDFTDTKKCIILK